MNNYTTESNTLINNTEANIMNNSTNELNTITNNTEVENMNNSNSELIALPKISMTNLFDDIAVKKEIKSPQDWTLDDCKERLHVIFKETDNEQIIVSVRLQGLTMLKINNNKTSMIIPNDSFSKEDIEERIKGCDEMIIEAHKRLLASLKKAKISRETTFKRKPKGARPEAFEIEQHGQDNSQPCCSE